MNPAPHTLLRLTPFALAAVLLCTLGLPKTVEAHAPSLGLDGAVDLVEKLSEEVLDSARTRAAASPLQCVWFPEEIYGACYSACEFDVCMCSAFCDLVPYNPDCLDDCVIMFNECLDDCGL